MAGFGPTPYGNAARNITSATVVKASAGTVLSVQVIVAGSSAGGVYDAATTGGNAAANQLAAIPEAIGAVPINMTCQTGILIVPGTGMTVAVSYQ